MTTDTTVESKHKRMSGKAYIVVRDIPVVSATVVTPPFLKLCTSSIDHIRSVDSSNRPNSAWYFTFTVEGFIHNIIRVKNKIIHPDYLCERTND